MKAGWSTRIFFNVSTEIGLECEAIAQKFHCSECEQSGYNAHYDRVPEVCEAGFLRENM